MANREQVVRDLDRVIGLIKTDAKDIPAETKQQMMKETIHHFNEYVSPGWLQYRKSVSSETDGDVVLEWEDGGSYFYGLNGEKFLDCLGGFGIYTAGHSEPEIVDVVKAQLNRQGLHSQELIDPLRGYLAKAMADITPGDLQYCFFTNGGAEAVEMALKLARIATGGRWVISTVGAFHGKTMGAVSMGGKGTYRTPYLPMIQQVQHVEYGVAEDVEKAIRNLQAVGEKVAAVILEPFPANAGLYFPQNDFLHFLREITLRHDSLLIFDEVMTGFRVAPGGVQQLHGITPDLTCMGKVIGGGLPVGAFGGRAEIMDCLSPIGPVYQAGTLSGNPVAMAAGLAQLRELLDGNAYDRLEQLGARLEEGIREAIRKHGRNYTFHRAGSMFCLFFTEQEVYDLDSAQKASKELFKPFFWNMLEQGVYFAPSPYETGFISTAHTEEDIDRTVEAVHVSLSKLG